MSDQQPNRDESEAPPVHFAYQTDQGILVARTKGMLPTSFWPEVIRLTLAEGSLHNCIRFLIDHRAATFHFKFGELWGVPWNDDSFRPPKGGRVALLFGSMPLPEKVFIEAFSGTRGHNVKVFNDEALATAWLLKPQPTILDGPLS
jgi:hypothetical protein